MTHQVSSDLNQGIPALTTIHLTRCPVPTASGLAINQGLFSNEPEFAAISTVIVQDLPELAGRHFDHRLNSLIREGGNIPALWAAARDQKTRLIGLTWVDEYQGLLTRIGEPLTAVRRLGLTTEPAGRVDFRQATSLKGLSSVLSKNGASVDDFELIEITDLTQQPSRNRFGEYENELNALTTGHVDAIFVKGAQGAEAAAVAGVGVADQLTAADPPELRVNNGTPRTITAHVDLLAHRSEVIEGYLRALLKASQWAQSHPAGFAQVVSQETSTSATSSANAYDVAGLVPSLSTERLDGLRVQQEFLERQGFIAGGLDLDRWVESRPLRIALETMDEMDYPPDGVT